MFSAKRKKELGIKMHVKYENTLTDNTIHVVVAENIVKARQCREICNLVGDYEPQMTPGGLFSWSDINTNCFIMLQTDELWYATITHECTHCVGRIYEMIQVYESAGEELIAAGVGNLCEAVIRDLQRHKLEIKTRS